MGDDGNIFQRLYARGADAIYDRVYEKAERPEDLTWPEQLLHPLLHAYLAGHSGRPSLLDIGSGPGIKAVKLAELGSDVTALEFSEKGVDWGREFAAERGVDAEFIQGDALEWESPQRYDIVQDFGLLHGFTTDQVGRYNERLLDHLSPSGDFFLAHFAPGVPGDRYFPIGPRRRGPDELVDLLPSELTLQADTFGTTAGILGARMGYYWFSRDET